MQRTVNAARGPLALLLVAGLVGLTAPALGAATDEPAPSAAAPGATPGAIGSDAAADKATDTYADAADVKGETVPIVTVENTPSGPKVESHDVDSAAEARSVATDAARGRDLVAVGVDNPVRAFAEPVQVGVESELLSVDATVPVPDALPRPAEESNPRPAAPSAPTPGPAPSAASPAAAPSASRPVTGGTGATVGDVVRTLAYTNDAYSGYQWAMNPANTSFLNAWSVTKGAGVTVAVVDTGVDASHPDLAGRVLPGHEFLNGGGIDQAVSPMNDNCGHGTHVAGTIAANAQNGLGIAGAAPGVMILPVRVLNCGGWSSDVAKGITWAANQGARVINLSVGGPGPDKALLAAVRYARKKGAVVVAAAGNNHGQCTSGKNRTSYPGATTGAIGVGAVDSNLQHACFSNTGSYVDLAAPGVGILSTLPNSQYAAWNGTSMATPHVAAAAALVLAKRPWCTPDRVEARLKATARRLPVGTAGDARRYGAGLVNPSAAVHGAC
jgi:subtilisin family serine protease